MQGVRAAELASRVLSGDRPRPLDGASNAYVFDWRQLQRWGLDETRLPAGSEVRFRQPSLWDLYKWPVLGGVAVVALQGALIVGLLVNRRQRRRAQRALAERLRFETLVAELSAAFITLPARDVPGQIEKALGRIVDELRLDRAILAELDDRRPDVIEVTHSWTRSGVNAFPDRSPRARSPGWGRVCRRATSWPWGDSTTFPPRPRRTAPVSARAGHPVARGGAADHRRRRRRRPRVQLDLTRSASGPTSWRSGCGSWPRSSPTRSPGTRPRARRARAKTASGCWPRRRR